MDEIRETLHDPHPPTHVLYIGRLIVRMFD